MMEQHNHSAFEALKNTCREACHSQKACEQGYRDLLAADSVETIASVWCKYFKDFVGGMFSETVCRELPYHYNELKDELNVSGIYCNECPTECQSHPLVIICDSDSPIHVYNDAEVYVLGKAEVIAHNHTKIHCQQPGGRVELLDYSVGYMTAGYTIARNRSTLVSSSDCECHDASNVTINDGILTDHGHYSIIATGDAEVNSFTSRNIICLNRAKITLR